MTIELSLKGKKSQYYTTNKNPLEKGENHFSSCLLEHILALSHMILKL
jgi:hypothetical protein